MCLFINKDSGEKMRQIVKNFSMILLMAVFMTGFVMGEYTGSGNFNKITTLDGLESGTYYVFYGINGSYTGAMTNTISGGRMGNTSVTPSGDVIVNPSTAIVWLVSGNSVDGYTVYNEAVSKYCEIMTNSTSGFSLNDVSSHEYDVSVNSGAFSFATNYVDGGARCISIYQSDWRPYASPNTLNLYKYEVPSSDPEPSNHVSSFSALSNGHNSINLSWSDNTGANAAAGFLIFANTTGSFTDPVDGTSQADDLDLSDNSGVKNISLGTEEYSFSGLNPETKYYFKIYPYSNSGDNIDYKTDGTVPTANATTDEAPPVATLQSVYISEVSDELSGYTTEYLEIYNTTGTSILMDGCYLERWSSDGLTKEYTYSLPDGIVIPSHKCFIIARGSDQTTFETNWSVDLAALNCVFDMGNSNLYFGTGRIFKLLSASDVELDAAPIISAGNRIYQTSPGNWSELLAKATATPGTLDAEQALPITLTSFTAKAVNGTIELTWETASETNNARFVIYRNGEAITSVDGAGTSSEPHSYHYVDSEVVPGVAYTYVLADVDYANVETKYEDKAVTVMINSDIAETDFTVGAAYPNPFNPSVTINFHLSAFAHVNAFIFNINGRLISELINTDLKTGHYRLMWDASEVPGGLYLLKMRSRDHVHIQKLVLLK
jgi:hypothetical protein